MTTKQLPLTLPSISLANLAPNLPIAVPMAAITSGICPPHYRAFVWLSAAALCFPSTRNRAGIKFPFSLAPYLSKASIEAQQPFTLDTSGEWDDLDVNMRVHVQVTWDPQFKQVRLDVSKMELTYLKDHQGQFMDATAGTGLAVKEYLEKNVKFGAYELTIDFEEKAEEEVAVTPVVLEAA